jgi:hypothetical protein
LKNGTTSLVEYIPLPCIAVSANGIAKLVRNCNPNLARAVSQVAAMHDFDVVVSWKPMAAKAQVETTAIKRRDC